MDGQELIQVNLQLPASALDSLSRLAEQLRLLTAESRRQHAAPQQGREQGENLFFDPERFQALRHEANTPEIRQPLTAGQAVEHTADVEPAMVQITDAEPARAVPVRAEAAEETPAPEGAGRRADQYLEDPAQAGPPGINAPDAAQTVQTNMREGASAQAVRQENIALVEEVPVVRTEGEQQVSDPQAVRMEPKNQIPEVEMVRAQTGIWDAVPPAVRTDALSNIAVPPGAGLVIAAAPDIPQSRWTGSEEEPAAAGYAPLTVESVSLAFQRDGRRYDNGFPLY